MKPKDFKRLIERDKRCLHCGETEAVSPNHRANRGMGGSRIRDVPSNLVLICSSLNFQIETIPAAMETALKYGWKLRSWEIPEDAPVYDALSDKWYKLDNDYSRIEVQEKDWQ